MFSKLIALSAFVVVASAQLPSVDPVILTPGANAGLCLTAGGTTDGSPVTVETCNGSAQQVWNFTASAGGATVSTNNGTMCLDVTGGVNSDGTLTQVWTCTTNDVNQNWFYTTDNRLAWTNMGKCLDLTGGAASAGTAIQVWTCTDNDANQVWDTVPTA